ncbi:FxsA cytoplasmic membrane protein [Nitrosococcus oceani ATCC 19707]|uniref:FxsA cytoplasmic membrane protein n=2 Tax=Nitrosococcus oceani TaxID=1229 RepID=Q3J727_NITOC|nr:FxsA family protein [Nitrosococcus oceani]ABA59369.1 FxsA cytoplasmic membrane protein [Nitrosococcus oceani ATCC 19707]EDZ66457.1 FxsA cytoplasmic membrane protein [Nitrosococcus oceani AFC27]KFI18102.1 exlusion protein FxsA [Nitrosococcus oceani C-27]GEM20061.1 exclusion protein FxsA [Nitrosococcus oceani]
MFRLLFIFFLTFPLIEIYLLIRVGSAVGAGWTVFLCIVTAMVGALLLRQQGFSTVSRVQASMARGQVPALEMLEGALLLVCGIFLLTPGFFTDTLGFLGLIPPVRRAFLLWVARRTLQRGGVEVTLYRQGQGPEDSDHRQRPRIIDGQAKREDE